jgi:dihydroflavonol-4-reductase
MSKASGERAVNEAINNGLDAVILSPTAIIGPADPEPSLTGKAIVDLYNHKIPSLVPGGYDWVDVRDVVSAAIVAMEKGRKGEKYLLSGHWHSLKELSAILQEQAGKKIVDTILPFWVARVGLPFISLYSILTRQEPLYTRDSLTIIHDGNRMINNSKARKELNFNPRSFSVTIRDMLLWFKEHKYIN